MKFDADGYMLGYGEVEDTLATTFDLSADRIRSRFRKLRLAGFPDDIQSGSGTRVDYDLPRSLAFAAVFALADGLASQAEAVRIVASTWPEWCAAFLASAALQGIIDQPPGGVGHERTVVTIAPEGMATRPRSLMVAFVGNDDPPGAPALCRLVVDVNPIVAAVTSARRDDGDLVRRSMQEIERGFGWERPQLPMRGSVADMPPQRGFFDDGPYFERALALLDAVEAPHRSPAVLWRLRVLDRYLAHPAPLDAWKAEIGDEPGRPRLRHLLGFAAMNAGLSELRWPETMRAAAGGDPALLARRMIEMAQSRRGTAVIDRPS